MLNRVNVVKFVGESNLEITHLSHHTDDVEEGTLFFCIEGGQVDSHAFAESAIKKGAKALVVGKPLPVNITQIVVNDTRATMSLIAQNFYGCPAQKMRIIGVVGTNGKTTVTHLIKSILEHAEKTVGVIGTNGIYVDGMRFDSELTTPDPIELNYILNKMVSKGVGFVVMEVSAHSIALKKMEGLQVDLAVFTNCTQDHLDFFHTMERYSAVKESFFQPKFARVGVVNGDDELGRKMINRQPIPIVSYGLDTPCDVFAINTVADASGIEYVINLYDDIERISCHLSGIFNVYNTIAAATACRVFGIKLPAIKKGLAAVLSVEGRNETFHMPNGARIVVDFAHTPDGFTNILRHLRCCTKGKLIAVFGCGGDRDRVKRPIMGKIASGFCDHIILTNDNPRSEKPMDIACQIQEGIEISHEVILDRGMAIASAVAQANAGDTVVILGKGAEQFIEMGGQLIPFNDSQMIKKLIKTS